MRKTARYPHLPLMKCRICGRRSLRACGARNGERIGSRKGGYYQWSKWNPCSDHAPGGLIPGIDALPVDGGLDDMSDIVVSTEGGTEVNAVPVRLDPEAWSDDVMAEIAKNGGIYHSN